MKTRRFTASAVAAAPLCILPVPGATADSTHICQGNSSNTGAGGGGGGGGGGNGPVRVNDACDNQNDGEQPCRPAVGRGAGADRWRRKHHRHLPPAELGIADLHAPAMALGQGGGRW